MDKLLILDIDETLVHATEQDLGRPCDFETEWYFVFKRPYVDEFLSYCFKNFKVAIWTSAGDVFAQEIYHKLIKPVGKPLFIWSSARCTPTLNPENFETIEVKNLDKVKKKGFSLSKVIMVDDTPEKLMKHYGNLVRVKEYLGHIEDDELVILRQYLDHLNSFDNIRKIEKRGWQHKYRK